MKSVIIYASRHHGNTEKLVRHFERRYGVTLIDAQTQMQIHMEGYDLIGFASGVDFGKLYAPVTEAAQGLPAGKKVYALYTCAKDQAAYGREIEENAVRKGCVYLGKYGCRGYNTYGPLKLIGGMNRNHPDANDLEAACAFYEAMCSAAEEMDKK